MDSKKAARRYVSKRENRRASSANTGRFPLAHRLLGYQRFFLLLADAVLCQLSSTVDPFGFESFGEIETPLSHSLAVYGWMVPITSVVMSDSKCPAIHLDVSLKKKKIIKKNTNVWPFDPKENRWMPPAASNCCARWPRKESSAHSTGRAQMDWNSFVAPTDQNTRVLNRSDSISVLLNTYTH